MTSRVAVAALGAVAGLNGGCAALMNGVGDRVTATSPTPGARVYVDGFDATQAPVKVTNDRPHVLLVRAPGYRDRLIELEPHVKPVPIVFDVIAALPTLFIVPLVDLSIGWWTAVDAPSDPVVLEADRGTPQARPTYSIAGHSVRSIAGAASGSVTATAKR